MNAHNPRPSWAAPTFMLLSIVGAVWPLAQFAPWLLTHGLNIALLWEGITATPLSRFAWADVVVTVLTIWALMVADRQAEQPSPPIWGPLLASVCVGASLALPLYLYLRERHADTHAASAAR